MEEWEYEMMKHVHHGEFRIGSSFAWEVRANITSSYPAGSTHEKSLPKNTRQSEFPHPPTVQTPFIKSPGKPNLCLVAPILGREALSRLVILDCSDVLSMHETCTRINRARFY